LKFLYITNKQRIMSFRIHFANPYIHGFINKKWTHQNQLENNSNNSYDVNKVSYKSLNLRDFVANKISVNELVLNEFGSNNLLATDSNGKIIPASTIVNSLKTSNTLEIDSNTKHKVLLGLSCLKTKSASIPGSQIQTNKLYDSGFNVEFDQHGFVQLKGGNSYRIDYKCTLKVPAKTQMNVFIYSLNKDQLPDSLSQHENFDNETHSFTFTGSALLQPVNDDGIALICDPQIYENIHGTIFIENLA